LIKLHRVGSNASRWRQEHLEVVLDKGDHFAELCGGCALPMLERVDPYGSLVLTSEEMEQFLAELAVLQRRETAGPHRVLLERVERLASECATSTDLQLRIDGD
jgi:hypothetical protein